MPVEPSNYATVVAAINKKYEDGLRKGNEQAEVQHISTGSPELDVAMGGGVPMGRWTRFYGGYGSTKTMTSLAVIASAQKMGLMCALYNVEKRYEKSFAERLGIDTKQLTVVQGTTIEGIGDKMESLLGVVHLHVIDSCTMAVSEDALNADIRDWRPGIDSRVWGKVFYRLNERWDTVDNTAIMIDQMRVKGIGTARTYEDPAGGKIFDHQSSMSVLFRTGQWLFRDANGILTDSDKAKKERGMDEQVVPAGREIKIRVEKSSVCRPFRTATLHYDLDTLEYDRVYEYMKAAKYYGIIRHNGGGNYEYVDDEEQVTKIKGEAKLREFIDSSPELQQYIHQTALEAGEAA